MGAAEAATLIFAKTSHHLNVGNWTGNQPIGMLPTMPNAKLHSTDFTLYALFCLSRLNLPVDTGALERLTGRTSTQVAGDLLQLGQVGRIAKSPAGCMRLTWLGLARAATLEPLVARASHSGAPPLFRRGKIKPMVRARPREDAVVHAAKLSA